MKPLVPIKRGQLITAYYLGTLAENQNELMQLPGLKNADNGARFQVPNGDQRNLDPHSVRDQQARAHVGLDAIAAGDVWREAQRVTSTVRVENPSDPTQFVDVERIESIIFVNVRGEAMAFSFDNA